MIIELDDSKFPKCYDYKMIKLKGNVEFQVDLIASAIECFNQQDPNLIEEGSLTVSKRTKDENGDWYTTVSVYPLSYFNKPHEVTKLWIDISQES
jgi:hypothetical protein